MKSKFYSFFIVNLIIILFSGGIGLFAGGQTEVSSEVADSGLFPAEKILIGVELYDLTDSETLQLKEYYEYLTESLNVEFKYSEAIKDAEGELNFIQDCAVAGADAFIAKYNITGAEQVAAVIDYGMYYYGQSENNDIYQEFKDESLYLGSISTGETDYLSGLEMGKWVKAQGFTKTVYSNGGANFGIQMFIDRQRGFLEGAGTSMDVIIVPGFPNDQFFANQETALTTEGLEAVATSINGVDYWAQPIASAGLKGKVALVTMGIVDEKMTNAFSDGIVDFLACGGSIQRYGLAVGMIINAVQGNADSLKDAGKATKETVSLWTISNAQDCSSLLDIQNNERIYTVTDVKSLCASLNPDASYATLSALVKKSDIDIVLGKN